MSNQHYILFVAIYEGGGRHIFDVSRYALSSRGDEMAGVIARNRQANGHLPAGKIVRVERYDGR